MTILNCPNCNAEIDTHEPHMFVNEIYATDINEHEEVCQSCKKPYLLVADWEVTFTAVKQEEE